MRICGCLAVGALMVAISAAPAAAQPITVVDGDTVMRGRELWRVSGIDAPEIHGAKCPAEREAGIRVAARLIALLHERSGRLIEAGRDKYGRRLGRLMLGWPSTGEDEWAAIAIRDGHGVAYDGKSKRHDWCAQR